MVIIWDERKRVANLAKHGLDFADVETGFDFLAALLRIARPSRTGRRRIRMISRMDGRLVAAIFSPLGSEALAIVSLRPANIAERREYDAEA